MMIITLADESMTVALLRLAISSLRKRSLKIALHDTV